MLNRRTSHLISVTERSRAAVAAAAAAGPASCASSSLVFVVVVSAVYWRDSSLRDASASGEWLSKGVQRDGAEDSTVRSAALHSAFRRRSAPRGCRVFTVDVGSSAPSQS